MIADLIEYLIDGRLQEFEGPASWNSNISAKITKSIIALVSLKESAIGKERLNVL